jgi:hypothetical protein
MNMPREVRAARALIESGLAGPEAVLTDDQMDLRALLRHGSPSGGLSLTPSEEPFRAAARWGQAATGMCDSVSQAADCRTVPPQGRCHPPLIRRRSHGV